LLDMIMPAMNGLEVLRQIKSLGVPTEVVIITGYSSVETAVEAMKLGATDYISKPFSPDELMVVLEKVFERSALLRENEELRRQLGEYKQFEGIIGESRPMQQIFAMIKRVGPTQGTVLITGESGTGKEMVARAIHNSSMRREMPFLACDCSSLAASLLESELFGHVKGSFSGAIATKKGLFEIAHGGTLFLDEVANISLETQAKLLRVLETRCVKKVGDIEEHEVDIRLLAATNRDLLDMVKEGGFREDLFYRLNVVPIKLPPLRERQDDIARLAAHFLERFKQSNAVEVMGFSPEAIQCLERYKWPGNVRELKNIVERLAILCDAQRVEPRHLPPEMTAMLLPPPHDDLPQTWEELKVLKHEIKEAAVVDLERRFIIAALVNAKGNVSQAAKNVGMQRTNFHALMRRFGIKGDDLS
jgi:DNA-binding NtrC family response regulator